MSPTTLIQQLSLLISQEQKCCDSSLVEDDPGSTSGQTCITGLGKGLIIRPTCPAFATDDQGSSIASLNQLLFPLFCTKVPKSTKLCDYILFSPQSPDSRLVVLLCELKSGNPRGAVHQIHGGMLLAEQIINVTLLHLRPTVVPTIEYRGLILSNKGIVQKQPTRPGRGYDFIPDRRTHLPIAHLRSGAKYRADALGAALPSPREHLSDPIRS